MAGDRDKQSKAYHICKAGQCEAYRQGRSRQGTYATHGKARHIGKSEQSKTQMQSRAGQST
jgi:hypothetical protein